jgi:hypothetical protein
MLDNPTIRGFLFGKVVGESLIKSAGRKFIKRAAKKPKKSKNPLADIDKEMAIYEKFLTTPSPLEEKVPKFDPLKKVEGKENKEEGGKPEGEKPEGSSKFEKNYLPLLIASGLGLPAVLGTAYYLSRRSKA